MRIEDVCTVFADGDWIETKDQSDSGIRLVQTGNIGEGIYVEKSGKERYISEETFNRLGCTEIFPGDILVSRLPDPVGRGCIIPEKAERMITAVDCTICRVNERLADRKYFCYFLHSPGYYQQLLQSVTGTTRKRISRKNLGNVDIQLPHLSIQQKVVDKLDRLSIIIDSRKREIQYLDDLIKARFVEMFGDPVANPKGWRVIPWEGVFDTKTGKLDSNAAVEGGKYPFFTCAKDWLWIDKYAYDCEALLLAGNNAAGVYDVKHYKGKFNAYQRTYILQLKDVDCSYSMFKYQLEDRLQYLQSQSKGTNTRYLTMGILNSLAFIVPPKEMQDEFTAFVAQVDKSKLIA